VLSSLGLGGANAPLHPPWLRYWLFGLIDVCQFIFIIQNINFYFSHSSLFRLREKLISIPRDFVRPHRTCTSPTTSDEVTKQNLSRTFDTRRRKDDQKPPQPWRPQQELSILIEKHASRSFMTHLSQRIKQRKCNHVKQFIWRLWNAFELCVSQAKRWSEISRAIKHTFFQ